MNRVDFNLIGALAGDHASRGQPCGPGIAPQQPQAVAPESPPARKWVVVRRPARDRAAAGTNGDGGAPDSSDAPAPPSAEPPTQPVPQAVLGGGGA